MPQGFVKKIERQLLLADLPLQLGYPSPRLLKIRRFARRLDRGSSGMMARASQRLGAAGQILGSPVMKQLVHHSQFPGQGRHTLTSQQPLNGCQLHLSAELTSFGHQSPLRTVPYIPVSVLGCTPVHFFAYCLLPNFTATHSS